MAIFANFIGVHKHADPNIRDLPGAERDATALHALFCDAVPQLEESSSLIVNDEATRQRVSEALQSSLGTATEEDTVILTFSGHGSRDHRLAMHDTKLDDLQETTISMEELSAMFKASKAKNILCILDCCFSGEAPARVLESSPISRDGMAGFQVLAGKGRVLIAASRDDEPAYELPGKNHGIFTAALIEVLLEEGRILSINEVLDKTMDIVRVESRKAGITQTPVSLGLIEGGFKFPAFTIGDNYSRAFPEVQNIRITSRLQDLANFGVPPDAITAWEQQFSGGLNALQLEAINDYRILDGKSLLAIAPTSSGKTFIGELAATKAISEGRKTVFLLPYRALVNEKYDQFKTVYGDSLGYSVIRCSGDYSDQVSEFTKGKYDIAFLTYEMFLTVALNNPYLMNSIGLIVIDEAQFITNETRGINVELLFTYLKTLRERNIEPQIIALSAVIGDVNDFDKWLGIAKLITTHRPVPLIEGVLDREGTYQYIDPETNEIKTVQFLDRYSIIQRRDKPSSQDVIVPLVQKLLSENVEERIILFRNTKGFAQGSAKYLANDLGLEAANTAISNLPTTDLSEASTELKLCLQGGTAFHNTNLNRQEREIIEREYRKRDGKIKVLASTSTLAAGVNTPASTVIIVEHAFFPDPYKVADYKNMAGRAGRMGFSENGRSILLADHASERQALFQHYVMGELDPLHSSFSLQDIETWILRLLAQINAPIPPDEVIRLLVNTYGGYLAVKSDPEWENTIVERLRGSMAEITQLGLVENENGALSLTLLGRASGRSALSFPSIKRLINILQAAGDSLTSTDLMALIQGLPEIDASSIPINKRGQGESLWPPQVPRSYGRGVVNALQRSVADVHQYYARCKKALILMSWINGEAVEEIERKYSTNRFWNAVNYGDIRGCADNTRFFLRSALQIASIMYPSERLSSESVNKLFARLEAGLPEDALALLNIPQQLARGDYLALYNAGIRSIEQLKETPKETIEDLLGEAIAQQVLNSLNES